MDATTQQPISNVAVRALTADRAVFTDSAGRFRIERLAPGAHLFEVARLGYETIRFDAELAEDTPVSVELFPDPVLLEGLTVARDRFEERLRFLPYPVTAWTEDDFRAYHLTDARMFVNDRSPWIDCLQVVAEGAVCKTLLRNREVILRVFIDDKPAERDWDEFGTYALDRVSRIEFVRHCAMIRLYTTAYMERIARGEVRMPRSIGGDCVMARRDLGLR